MIDPNTEIGACCSLENPAVVHAQLDQMVKSLANSNSYITLNEKPDTYRCYSIHPLEEQSSLGPADATTIFAEGFNLLLSSPGGMVNTGSLTIEGGNGDLYRLFIQDGEIHVRVALLTNPISIDPECK